jgi:hypothetical protein
MRVEVEFFDAVRNPLEVHLPQPAFCRAGATAGRRAYVNARAWRFAL